MDALTLLRAEHQTVGAMLGLLEGDSRRGRESTDDLGAVIKDLITAETRRALLEEQVFWPAVRQTLPDGDALADHAIAQEEAGMTLRRRLEARNPGEPGFDEALSEFVTAARERMLDEECLVWPRVAAALSPEQLQNLGGRLEHARSNPPRSSTA